MKLLKIFAIFSLVVLLCPTALAAGYVSYDGISRDFVFLPEDDYAPLRLFPNLEQITPGGQQLESVRISGCWDSNSDILVYLCADDGSEGANDRFLSQLTLEIEGQFDRLIFYGPLDKAAKWIYLGSYQQQEQEQLYLKLTASAQQENSAVLKDISWRFLAVERPAEELPEVPVYLSETIPKTGDASPLLLCSFILLCSGTGLAILLGKKRM